jgi:8-oxo-dGTP pyrophosphatase MutT (NUDIX family)
MLVRDQDDRVLMCQLTYKPDWDLPGGVIEVGESPRLGVTRELEEELGVTVPAGELLITDWLPPWSGWEDALCLVFDGGIHDQSLPEGMLLEKREIAAVAFKTLAEIRDLAADFTARRVEAALARAHGGGSPFTESGRPQP